MMMNSSRAFYGGCGSKESNEETQGLCRKQRLIIKFMFQPHIKMPKIESGHIRIFISIRNNMNFTFVLSLLVFVAMASASGLRQRGIVQNGRLEWAGLTPQEMQILRKLYALKCRQKYGRFCKINY